MTPPLLNLQEMPPVAGLKTPEEFYVVINEPAPLAGMPYPGESTPWNSFFQLGLRYVVQLETNRPNYDPSPLKPLFSVNMQDLFNGRHPRDPQAEEVLILQVVSTTLDKIKQGEGVIVHCAGGTGRTGTIHGCCLVGLGYPADRVIRYLDRLNKARGKSGWPESPWQAEMVSKFASILDTF
jgi:protein-tyrosine phosphatase